MSVAVDDIKFNTVRLYAHTQFRHKFWKSGAFFTKHLKPKSIVRNSIQFVVIV